MSLQLLAHLGVVQSFGCDGGKGATARKYHRLLRQHEELLLYGLLQLFPMGHARVPLVLGCHVGGSANLIAHQ